MSQKVKSEKKRCRDFRSCKVRSKSAKVLSKNGCPGKSRLEAGHTVVHTYCGKSIRKRCSQPCAGACRKRSKETAPSTCYSKSKLKSLCVCASLRKLRVNALSAGKEMSSIYVRVQRPGWFWPRRCAVPRKAGAIRGRSCAK